MKTKKNYRQVGLIEIFFVDKLDFLSLFVCFYKRSYVLRVVAVIFELDKISMSNFVKFKFRSMTLKIERVFEKTNQTLSQNCPKGP